MAAPDDTLPTCLGDIHVRNARRWPDRPAYVFGAQAHTHAQFLARARQVAGALHGLGVQAQDRVALLAQNCMEYFEVYGACEVAGIVMATVNFRLAAPELVYVINDGGARVLVFEAIYAPVIGQIRAQLPQVEHFVCITHAWETEPQPARPAWALDYHAWAAAGDAATPLRLEPNDVAHLMYTSGTTGKAKGCLMGQRERVAAAVGMQEVMGCDEHSRLLLAMPLFHTGAKSLQLGVTHAGGAIHLQRGFSVEAILAGIERDRIDITFMAPVMAQMLFEAPAFDRHDVGSLRTFVYGAAPMPVTVLRKGLARLGPIFIQLFGQTEVGGTVLRREHHRPEGSERERRRLASVGRAMTGCEIRIVDDDGRDCAAGVPGEILLKSGTVFRGYLHNPAATAATLRDGWCQTGDVGYLDEDGFLYLVDRKKDMIISGGENIYSLEVEEALLQHPAVQSVAVIGMPHPRWGEAVRAVVVLAPGASTTEAALIEHARGLIASYKKPASVVFVEALPTLASGKVNKVALREQFAGARM